jgi:hypothetical protein
LASGSGRVPIPEKSEKSMVNMLEFIMFIPSSMVYPCLSQKDPIDRGLSMFIPFHVVWMAQVGF